MIWGVGGCGGAANLRSGWVRGHAATRSPFTRSTANLLLCPASEIRGMIYHELDLAPRCTSGGWAGCWAGGWADDWLHHLGCMYKWF